MGKSDAIAKTALQEDLARLAKTVQDVVQAAHPWRHTIEENSTRCLEPLCRTDHRLAGPNVDGGWLAGCDDDIRFPQHVVEKCRICAGAIDQDQIVVLSRLFHIAPSAIVFALNSGKRRIAAHFGPSGQGLLWIQVDQRDSLSDPHPPDGEMRKNRGFPSAAFLLRESQNVAHRYCVSRSFLRSIWENHIRGRLKFYSSHRVRK